MTPGQAAKLNDLLLKIGADLNQSVAYVRDHDSGDEFRFYRNAIGKLMGDLFSEAMEPLWKRFPELEPESLGGRYKVPSSVYEPIFYDYLPGDDRPSV